MFRTLLSSSLKLDQVPDADVELAACYVSDAIEGRTETCSAQMVGRPAWERRMYALNTWIVWELWLQFVGLMLMLRAFMEPGYSLSGLECHPTSYEGSYELALLVAEAIALGCFWLDIYAKLVYMGRVQYWSRTWHKGYLLVVLCVTTDAACGATCSQRPLRFVRPMLIGLRNHEQRRILLSLLHLLSHQLGVALLSTIGVVAFAGALGVHLYGASFDEGLALQLQADGADANHLATDLNHLKGTFNSFVHAAVEIWVFISSAENFLDLLLPAMRTSGGGTSFLPLLVYFGPLLYFGYFFLMSVLLAVVVDEYLLTARRLVQQEHRRERKGLIEAFALLNPSRTGYVDLRTWTRLIVALRPGCSRQEAVLRYHMVAKQAPERGVYVREFLRLHSNLAVNLVEDHASGKPAVLLSLPDSLRLALLAVNALLFVAYSPLQPTSTHRAFFAAHTALLPPLTLDRAAWTPSRRALNGGCLAVANACAIAYWTCELWLGVAPPLVATISGHVALIVLLIQSTRILRLIVRLLSYVLPQFLAVSASVFLIVYVFGLAGMQLFHELPLTSADERYAHENLPGCANPFGSLPCTLFVLFQVMTNEDWHVILRAMWSAAGATGLAYVLAFFLVVNVCLLSLTTALAINAFLASKTDLLDEGLLFDSSLDDHDAEGGGRPGSRFSDVGGGRSSPRPSSPALGGSPRSFKRAPRSSFRGASSPSSPSAAGGAGGSAALKIRSACAALHEHDDEASLVALDEHQELHITDEGHMSVQLEQAELAMREHEAFSARDEHRPTLARQIPRGSDDIAAARSAQTTQANWQTPYAVGLGRPSNPTAAKMKHLAKVTALPNGGSAVANAAAGGARASVRGGTHRGRTSLRAAAGGGSCSSADREALLTDGTARSDRDPSLAGRLRELRVESNDGPSSAAFDASDVEVAGSTADRPPSPADDVDGKLNNKKWRVASRTVTMFSRRAAAGLGGSEEPLDDDEVAAIAELTQHERRANAK